jgi:SAM-dependent methyltransferase
MSLVRCPECGREKVSSTASSCPSCGFDLRAYFEANPSALAEAISPSEIQEHNPLTLAGTLKLALFHRQGQQAAESALSRIPKGAKGNLLLVGYGTGALIEAVIRRTQCHIVATDPSPSHRKKAAKWNLTYLRGGRLELLQCDLRHLPGQNRSYDYILVTNQCYRWQELEPALARLSSLLAEGGTLLFALSSPASAAKALDTPVTFDPASLTQAAEQAGFHVSGKSGGKILVLKK